MVPELILKALVSSISYIQCGELNNTTKLYHIIDFTLFLRRRELSWKIGKKFGLDLWLVGWLVELWFLSPLIVGKIECVKQ